MECGSEKVYYYALDPAAVTAWWERSIMNSHFHSKQGTEDDMAAYDSLMVFTGNANPKLAENVVKHLDISLGRASVTKN